MFTGEDGKKHYEFADIVLPPGPWRARGNKILAGDDVVAVVMCRNASAVARILATFPERAENVENTVEMEAEIARLKGEIEALEDTLEEARSILD